MEGNGTVRCMNLINNPSVLLILLETILKMLPLFDIELDVNGIRCLLKL
jgi:hypothetical protein